jgi:hypothetical protein
MSTNLVTRHFWSVQFLAHSTAFSVDHRLHAVESMEQRPCAFLEEQTLASSARSASRPNLGAPIVYTWRFIGLKCLRAEAFASDEPD